MAHPIRTRLAATASVAFIALAGTACAGDVDGTGTEEQPEQQEEQEQQDGGENDDGLY